MDHLVGLELLKEPHHERRVRDRAFDDREAGVRRQTVTPAGGEIVDDQDLIPSCQQTISHVGTDEPCTTGNENLHGKASAVLICLNEDERS